jgi:hypothetical protein
MNIKIDNEFRTLIPPLTAEEFSHLEANCLENGIQDSLKTWDGILIDGHNRYEVATKHGLEFTVTEMEFESREAVKLWIIRNQLGRRNLSTYDRSVLALKLKPVIAEMAKKKQAEYHGNQYDGLHQKSDKEQIVTDKEVGKIAEVSHDTIHKVDVIENSGNEDIKNKVRNKEMSIDKAYREVKGLPPKKQSPRIEEPVQEEPLQFEEDTSDCFEASEEVSEAIEIAGLRHAEKILNGMAEIVNTVKYSHEDVVEEISKLNCDGFSMDEFLSSIDECMKVLARLQNGLNGLTVRTE